MTELERLRDRVRQLSVDAESNHVRHKRLADGATSQHELGYELGAAAAWASVTTWLDALAVQIDNAIAIETREVV